MGKILNFFHFRHMLIKSKNFEFIIVRLLCTIAIEQLLLLHISGTIAIAIGIAKSVPEVLLLILLLLRESQNYCY